MTKTKTLEQLRAEKERAETQLAQEQHMTASVMNWKIKLPSVSRLKSENAKNRLKMPR